MVIIAKGALQEFVNEHHDAADPLNKWYSKVRECNWGTFGDVKRTFNSVDAVGNDRYVFNIKGNTYRLVAMIHFDRRTLYIRFIGTHASYDKINCSTI